MSYLHVPFLLHFATPLPLKLGLEGLLSEKIKQYPVLYNKQINGRKIQKKRLVSNIWDAVAEDLELIKNGKSTLILLFMLYMG